MGVNFESAIARAPAGIQHQQFPRMAAAGVETTRVVFSWANAQPEEHGAIGLGPSDRLVRAAAARRLRVLPTVIFAPRWARRSEAQFAPARDPGSMRRYVRALVDRYGPRGSFWTQHPRLPRLPIRDWQFWNEPHFTTFWTIPRGEDWARSYTAHLEVFHTAVKERDPRARVVLAGVTNNSWNRLRELYAAGAKRFFEVAAVHPFTAKPRGVITILSYCRDVMERHRDARTPMFATEIGLPAAKGKVANPSDARLQTTPRGMARFLSTTYRLLATQRRKLRLSRAYWYSWATEYQDNGDIFRFAGLLSYRPGQRRASPKPAYWSYVRTARRLEGCRKGRSGRCR